MITAGTSINLCTLLISWKPRKKTFGLSKTGLCQRPLTPFIFTAKPSCWIRPQVLVVESTDDFPQSWQQPNFDGQVNTKLCRKVNNSSNLTLSLSSPSRALTLHIRHILLADHNLTSNVTQMMIMMAWLWNITRLRKAGNMQIVTTKPHRIALFMWYVVPQCKAATKMYGMVFLHLTWRCSYVVWYTWYKMSYIAWYTRYNMWHI